MSGFSIPLAGHPPLEPESCRVIAEAGVNHSNSVDRAIEMAAEAARAGAWAIKFQMYKAESLSVRDSPKYWTDTSGTESQFETFKRGDHLGYADYRPVAEACRDLGIAFFATPFDAHAVEAMEELDAPLYKIASGDVTHKPLLEIVASTGKPILLSTGAAEREEIDQAMEWLGVGPERLILLVCTLSYPTSDEDGHFARIESFRQAFAPYLIGVSDHTLGPTGGCVAAALGGVCIEKHYTLDKTLRDLPDHKISIDPPELAELVEGCNRAAMLRGNPEISVHPSELPARENARRSIVAARDLPIGTVLGPGDMDFKRPGSGLAPVLAEGLVGKVTKRDIGQDEMLAISDLA